jgi:hypothetical protein
VGHLSLAQGQLSLTTQRTEVLTDRANDSLEDNTRPLPVTDLEIGFTDP